MLYACSQRVGTFVETLARFRPDPAVMAALADIDGEDDAVPAGSVERSWLARRRIGVAEVAGCFVEIGHSGSLAVLSRALAGVARAHGLPELDAAAIRLSAPRAVTQRITRWVYDHSPPDGRRRYAGVRYASRLADELANWAIFRASRRSRRPRGRQRHRPAQRP